MANEIMKFDNERFGSIRALSMGGEPWFVAKDVCNALGLGNTGQAIAKLDQDEKGITNVDTLGGIQQVSTISEPGFYKLVLKSRKPEAKAFQRWVTHEVLPSIRRDGAYVASDGTEDDATLMARALIAAQRTIERNKRELDEMRPKALFADAVSASHTAILVGDLAKLLKQNGVEMGQNRLFQWLRERGYLMKSGASRNMPTQRSMELGLFEVKERTINNPDGSVRITKTTKVTGKGQQYFINQFLSTT